jgi:ubiquinone biosynthesis protein Coq4
LPQRIKLPQNKVQNLKRLPYDGLAYSIWNEMKRDSFAGQNLKGIPEKDKKKTYLSKHSLPN